MVQNKEPSHFCRIFKSGVIVRTGQYGQDRNGDTKTELYRVRSTSRHNVRAVQVPIFNEALTSCGGAPDAMHHSKPRPALFGPPVSCRSGSPQAMQSDNIRMFNNLPKL